MLRVPFRLRLRAGAHLRAGAAGAATLTFVLALHGTASAAQTNTFTGECSNVPVVGTWPTPLTLVPQYLHFIALLDGGSCSGTVNGQPFMNVPLRGRTDFYGVQSCEEGEQTGRTHFVIDGKNLFANTEYRRAGRDVVLVFTGDAGGQMVMKAYGRVGFFNQSSPFAKYWFLQPFVEPIDAQQFVTACAGPGVSRVDILVQYAQDAPSISSPAHEPGAGNNPDNPAPGQPPAI